MIVNIKYFGQIAEATQKIEESLECQESSISELIKRLIVKYPDLKNKDFKVAQNQELVSIETLLTGEELALLPPFAGG
ncbi:MoaD/ThiS family protein [Flavobacteriaceae bacterium SZ-1-7]|uniref:MoaD/ThiS family protein n=1 Tax=Tamlana sedimenti TaxID=3134126 RepID=UPI00312A2F81